MIATRKVRNNNFPINSKKELLMQSLTKFFRNEKMLNNIEESIEILKNSKIDFEFRTTVVPSLLKKKDILKIARWIGPAKKYYLQNFRAEKTINSHFEKVKPYPRETLLEIKKAISHFFEICEVR